MTIRSLLLWYPKPAKRRAGSGAILTMQPPIIGEVSEQLQAAWDPHHLVVVASRSSHDARKMTLDSASDLLYRSS